MIKLDNIDKIYNNGNESLHVLKGVTLSINRGESIAIMGQSGSGKSTLLKIIGLLDTDYEGTFFLNGSNLNFLKESDSAFFRGQHIGFVFQDFQLISNLTVFKNIELSLIACGQYNKKKNENKIIRALEDVGLLEKKNHLVTSLSGGQKQRISLARAIAKRPSIIIADEPTGALDKETSKEILQIFQKLNADGQTIIIVTHDSSVAKTCNKILHLENGRLYDYKI